MPHRRSYWLTFFCLAGCSTSTVLQPAIAPNLSELGKEEIVAIIEAATQSTQVTITRQVFSTSHILALESSVAHTPQGKLATGRNLEKPETFHLLSDGVKCFLKQLSTGDEFRLRKTPCRILDPT